MSGTVDIKELPEATAAEVIIQPAKSGGWLAWYAQGDGSVPYWMLASPGAETHGQRDPWRCPYPLFTSREEAVSACAKALAAGGQCRVMRVSL